ncbi:MAG: membrane protein insertase YidC [Gammaproteobacteria bacterium]
MDNIRLVLFMALSFVVLLLWQAWQQDYRTPPAAPTQTIAKADAAPPSPNDVPQAVPAAEPTLAPEVQPQAAARTVRVRTDVLELQISETGATVVRAALREYPVSRSDPTPLTLLDDGAATYFTLQSGLLADHVELPNHLSQYAAAQPEYTLADGADRLEARLRWQGPAATVEKIFELQRGSYLVNVRYEIQNGGTTPINVRPYAQLQRHPPAQGSMLLASAFTGIAYSLPGTRYQKVGFDDLAKEPIDFRSANAWVGMVQHYFVTALVPPAQAESSYYSKVLPNERYIAGLYLPAATIPPGGKSSATWAAYAGPKLQDDLAAIAPGLDLVVDYGVLWFIAKPLFHILTWLHAITQNWGWSIIFLTIFVKGVFFYPSAVGYKSMAKMRKVAPRLQQIRENFPDDRARQQQAMMEIYKAEQINPLSGCLPILIQIPVFLALYWVLLESVELRQAPFLGWLRDLSTHDPYFVLPLVMGVTMFVQQRLNPPAPDPVQQRVMQILPLVFTVMMAWFPAGLVLYWTVSNVLSIAQQWVITRKIAPG